MRIISGLIYPTSGKVRIQGKELGIAAAIMEKPEILILDEMKMGVVESHFADIIWANEPLHSRELVKLCEKELNWNRSTTYTVLRKLCERGIFQNNGGIVSSVLSKNDFYAVQSEQFVDETFEGSLPAFIAAFTQRKGISQQEAAEIRRMIDAAAGKE